MRMTTWYCCPKKCDAGQENRVPLSFSERQPPPATVADARAFETFGSRVLQYFIDNLYWHQDSQVLDIGPVCGNNITFFAERIRRLYVCDLFVRLQAHLQTHSSSDNSPVTTPIYGFDDLWKVINYGREIFDGIILWHLGDHLADGALAELVRLCHLMLKPEGLLAVYACDKSPAAGIYGFRMLDTSRLQRYAIPSLSLPVYYRTNREMIAMLNDFSLLRSFIYRNGVREFAFRKS